MKTLLCLLLFQVISLGIFAQRLYLPGINERCIHSSLLEGEWPAQWITNAAPASGGLRVCLFRKRIQVPAVSEHFYVHVSADNRYKFYVNGTLVSLGPARSDVENWNFATLDLAPYINKGNNTLAVEVWAYENGFLRPLAQMGYDIPMLLMQGNTRQEEMVNTDSSWKCLSCTAITPYQKGIMPGYTVVGPGEQCDGRLYPWGWNASDYDDTDWRDAVATQHAAVKGTRDYTGRQLIPASIPAMELTDKRLKRLRKVEGNIEISTSWPERRQPLTVPANRKVKLILDNDTMTTAYMNILLSGGKDATVEIAYAEALYKIDLSNPAKLEKLNREDIQDKYFLGNKDMMVADGGENRLFTSLWWRAYRYVELSITTADAPLTVEDIYGTFTAYPFKRVSDFQCKGRSDCERILDVGWRTARLCANETYMDCPYFEQLQYFGDARIQAMITLYNTRDTMMVRHSIEQGRHSLTSEGLTQSRYPSSYKQMISSYALSWIGMIHDYWMMRPDTTYVRSLLPCTRSILAWYESYLNNQGQLKKIPYWFFADWASDFVNGEPKRDAEGCSAYQDLCFLMALQEAAAMEQDLGLHEMSRHYQEIIALLRRRIKEAYWDASTGLFADTSNHDCYSQHVNALALLTGMEEDAGKAREICRKLITDRTLTQATLYFRYYVHRAMDKAGMANCLLDCLQAWQEQLALNLTTFAETPDPTRSDCHAWSASPNVEFYRMILGIRPATPGFGEVSICPALCGMNEVKGSIPHPQGDIRVEYQLKNKKLHVRIELPTGVMGTFEWQGKNVRLKEGIQLFSIY